MTGIVLDVWSPPIALLLERGAVRRFADAVGETNPAYSDVAAAGRLGYPDLPVLPTYLFTLESHVGDTLAFLQAIGVDTDRVLHGEQSFRHHFMVHAGDEVTLTSRWTHAQDRPDRSKRILRRETLVSRDDQVASQMRATWVLRTAHAPQ